MNVDIEDFYKEHKTLNVNMNNESQALNNKITFDSEKYRQTENTRPSATIENLNTISSVEKCSNAKRFKCTNMESAQTSESENKRIRLESIEKNVVMETERRESGDCRGDQARLSEAIEADKYWEKYLVSVAACVFSWAAIRHPHYTYRRVSAFLHLLTAITTLTVIQLVDGGASTIMSVAKGDSLLYGYSFLLAWVTFLFSLAASITFLAASRKRKLLDNDNVNFTHQKLDISIPQN